MRIYYSGDGGQIDESIVELMEKAVKLCLALEGATPEEEERAELSVTYVGAEEIQQLNRDYRNVDKVTDVLSFPLYESLAEFPEEGEIALGDVVINCEKAKEQALEYGHSYEREIVYLFTHSVLHLLGYDHEESEDKKEMRKREEEIMEVLGIGK